MERRPTGLLVMSTVHINTEPGGRATVKKSQLTCLQTVRSPPPATHRRKTKNLLGGDFFFFIVFFIILLYLFFSEWVDGWRVGVEGLMALAFSLSDD